MKSLAASSFWKPYRALPDAVRREARGVFHMLCDPRLYFERVRSHRDSWSVRVTRDYRAVGRMDMEDDSIVWYWIGSHTQFDKKFPV